MQGRFVGLRKQQISKGGVMNTRQRVEVFSAGCSACKETIEMVK